MKSDEVYEFKCYMDRDLNIPAEFAEKIINHVYS